jgi:hypothetical protein
MSTSHGGNGGIPRPKRNEREEATSETRTAARAHRFAGLPLLKTLPDYDELPQTRETVKSSQANHANPPSRAAQGPTHGPRPTTREELLDERALEESHVEDRRRAQDDPRPRMVGRYVIGEQIGAGGLATVHIGHERVDGGTGRVVAIKRLHPQLAREPEVAATLLDEGRIVARITHPNVVSLFDIVVENEDIFLVLEYVEGESLATLMRTARSTRMRIPAEIALGVVHRDVSPHNVLVGADGRARILDFGLATAAGQSHTTRPGEVKGKLSYMAPEHLRGGLVTRRSDLYSTAIVLWEMLTLDRPFGDPKDPDAALHELVSRRAQGPSTLTPGLPPAIDPVVLRALALDPSARYATADEMARHLERALPAASPARVAAWVRDVARARASGSGPANNPRWHEGPPDSGFRIKDFSH